MILIWLLRWLRGTVTFAVSGGFPERFINVAIKSGFPIWDVTAAGGTIKATTYAKKYRKIIPLAKKARVNIRAIDRRGLAFINWRYRKRVGILAGLAFFVLAMALLSGRVWTIEIEGVQRLSHADVVNQLSDLGLSIGSAKKSINTNELEKRMMLKNNEISFIAINLENNRAEVQISERIVPPDRINPKAEFANIVAAEDGQIKRLEIYDGQAMVAVGDTVSKGDVIVSGIMEDGHFNTRMVYSRAKVVARVYHTLEATVQFEQIEYVPFGENIIKKSLVIDDFSIPLNVTKLPKYDKIDVACKKTVVLGNPLTVVETCEITPLKKREKRLTEFEAKEQAMLELKKAEADLGADHIVSRNVAEMVDQAGYTVSELLIIEKDIAETAEILIN